MEQHWHQTSMPVVAVDDIGMASGAVEEFEHGHGVTGKAFRVVRLAMDDPTAKEVLGRTGVDEPAGDAVDLALIEITGQGRGEKGQVQLQWDLFQSHQGLQAQAIVAGQDDFHPMPLADEFPRQALDEVPQAAGLGDRGALGTGEDDMQGFH